MNFSNHTFLTNSVYGSTFTTLTLFISQSCKNKEHCDKTRFEFVEMHTNPLDPHLICIIRRWVFDLNSLNLEVYLNTPAIVCIKRIYHVDEVRIGKTRGVNLLVWTEPWRGPDGRFIPRVFPILTSSTWLIIYLAYSLLKIHINWCFSFCAPFDIFSA